MKCKMFRNQEFSGIFVTTALTLLLWNVYELSGEGIAVLLVGSVNNSIWEKAKGLVFSYIFYGLFELITSKPYFKQFVVAKFAGLYCGFLLYITLRSSLVTFYNSKTDAMFAFVALITGHFISYKLTLADYPLKTLFPTACFMIMLLFVLCFTFTAFPPVGMIFQDPVTGLYGIVPDYLDVGAIILDKLYA